MSANGQSREVTIGLLVVIVVSAAESTWRRVSAGSAVRASPLSFPPFSHFSSVAVAVSTFSVSLAKKIDWLSLGESARVTTTVSPIPAKNPMLPRCCCSFSSYSPHCLCSMTILFRFTKKKKKKV